MIQTATFLLVIGALTVTAQDGSRLAAVCTEPLKVGPCKARFERYFYNSTSKQCELFYWGGCQPNGNNFQTLSQCQTTCPSGGCIYNKKWYANGATIQTSNPCEYCRCNDGQVNCAIRKCARPACSNPTWITGQCCPVCPKPDIFLPQLPVERAKRAVSVQVKPPPAGCFYKTVWYPNGPMTTPDPCEFCTCNNGQVACALILCPPTPCKYPVRPPGQCCPVCKYTELPAELARSKRAAPTPGTCYHNKKRYPNGATWKPSACEHCSCRDGKVNCAIQDCAAPQCANPTTTPGQCCPVCKYPGGAGSCFHNNNWYANGARIPTSSPCEHCSCNNGQVNCAIQDCARPPCSNPTGVPGQCCPVCNNIGLDDLALAPKVKRAARFPQLRCPQFMPPPEGFKCEKYDRRCSDTGSDKCPKGKVCCNMPCGTACY